MNDLDVSRSDWESALAAGLSLTMVVELGLLSTDARQALLAEHSIWPLLHQADMEHLRYEGPAMVELSGQPFSALQQQYERLAPAARHGWLSSRLSMLQLQQHLGDALACRDIDGDTLLIRSYAHNVLPALHARREQPWHAWLFGPIEHWWLPNTQGWQGFEGLAQASMPAYQPIELDQALVEALGVDLHAQALAAELQQHAPEVFLSDCHGERLDQVGQALAHARAAGLSQQSDQSFHALYSLMSGQSLSQHPDWPLMVQRVEHEGLALANVIAERDEQG
ncbi:DUF4123 domain-containing protein [Ectopseudomonas chengduensis]|jgi:hypothetical protein|nr:DUF4123 domain-containing protein [uncultured Pseudomonas sp.]